MENEYNIIEEAEDEIEKEESDEDDVPDNLPLSGSPLYPRIYVGDSAKPLMGEFGDSEYRDDNISRTYMGLLTSFYG